MSKCLYVCVAAPSPTRTRQETAHTEQLRAGRPGAGVGRLGAVVRPRVLLAHLRRRRLLPVPSVQVRVGDAPPNSFPQVQVFCTGFCVQHLIARPR